VERLSEAGARVFGPAGDLDRGGAVSFEYKGVHPHDLAELLNADGIAVRAGHHCAQPLMGRLGVPATTRASFYVYNSRDEVDALVASLERAGDFFS
jgi:cysteine desulfurase/selenocysteine lyase